MSKIKRKIIKIDEEKCNGCGLCIPACPEGALQLMDTPKGKKARLVKEIYCDGLGACLGHCPQDAITIEEEEAKAYDEEATLAWIKETAPERLEEHLRHLKEHSRQLPQFYQHEVSGGCPGAKAGSWEGREETKIPEISREKTPSELRQWPVKIALVPPQAPYLKHAPLLISADCVPFSYPNFHRNFLKGRVVLVGCPKLDDLQAYMDKLADIFRASSPESVTVIHMEVPCCFGLVHAVREAISRSGKPIPFQEVTISIKGEVL